MESNWPTAIERSPVWSPNGSQIVFTSDTPKYATSWSKDGRFLLFDDQDSDIWALPISGDRKPFPVVHTEFVEHDG
jgi:Tol biopolymer transport system component